MNYHLNHNGQDLGIFPLSELRQRRAAGELTGAEFVWCEGMAGWQTLEFILQQSTPPKVAPASAPKSNSNRIIAAVLAVGAVLFILAGISTALVLKRVMHRAQAAVAAEGESSEPASGSASAMEAASRPVETNPETYTVKQVTERNRDFRVRQYVEGYRERGERNPATDALALGYLENWIADNYGGPVNTNLPQLAILGNQLATNAACTDPLVLTAVAVESVELHESIQRLERAVRGFENSKHLGYPKFYATVMLRNKLIQNRNERIPVLDALAVQRLKEALADGSITAADQDTIGEILISGWANNFFERNGDAVVAAVVERGKPLAWLALVLGGELEINNAWRARGTGYAGSVSEAGWKGFSEHLGEARKQLTKAWQMRRTAPLAACRMMTVALGDSDIGEMRLWFDRTVAAQVDYAGAWNEMRWGLRPRWYGTPGAMLAFGATAVNTHRFDTDVPRKLFDVIADLETELNLPAGQHIYGRADVWPQVQEMYEGYVAATTDETQRGWRSTYAVVAYLAGKNDIACQQLAALNWAPNYGSLTGWGRDLSLLGPEMAARTSDQATQVAQAEAQRQTGDLAGALKLYQEIPATNLSPAAQIFVGERLASLTMESRLQAGEWVNFLPTTTNLTGWQVERGQCRLLPDGALEVQSDQNGHLLYSRVRMSTDFEVTGKFEVVRSSDQAFQAGLALGLPQWETQNWLAFRIKRNANEGDVASVSRHWTVKQILSPLPLDARMNSFLFRFQDGKVTASINGHEVFRNVAPPKNSLLATDDFRLGLGAFNDSNATTIRYANLQVRQLSKR